MTNSSELQRCIGKRIVLTCSNNLSYAGVAKCVICMDRKDGLVVQLDQQTGFSIWCPLDVLVSIMVIPIPEEESISV